MDKPPQDESFTRLESLDALGAIRAWLDDDYGYGEDGVLVQAIRRETGITLDDHAVWEVLSTAQADDATAATTLAVLLAAASSAVVKPRSPRGGGPAGSAAAG